MVTYSYTNLCDPLTIDPILIICIEDGRIKLMMVAIVQRRSEFDYEIVFMNGFTTLWNGRGSMLT